MLHLPECAVIIAELQNNLPTYIDYHTVSHTLDVFHSALEIADEEGISAADRKLLGIAAVYHDSGYIRKSVGHEEISCEIVTDHLRQFKYPVEDIKTICGIIMATRVPQKPTTLLQQIICDADMVYLGRDDFFALSDRLYREFQALGMVANKSDWNLMQIDFLKQHHYFTKFAIDRWQYGKEQNLKAIESKIAAL